MYVRAIEDQDLAECLIEHDRCVRAQLARIAAEREISLDDLLGRLYTVFAAEQVLALASEGSEELASAPALRGGALMGLVKPGWLGVIRRRCRL
ncbi:hypothetical protein CK936_07690 [Streptomyces albireticuli]|uniref:Uncharacterized protein n=1 Tax=Streptomyces albireticuli TaxID=1940 RepID=A0A2A2DD72_9ACTN|nr:hypothetical protein CK936_07690 [Streptomyces albireticuli]